MAYLETPHSKKLKECYFMFISHYLDWFTFDYGELKLFYHILLRTLNFGKEEFSITLLTSNANKFGLSTATICTPIRTLYRSLNKLEKRWLILPIPDTRPVQYLVNSPAIIYAMLKVYELSGKKHPQHKKYEKVAGLSLAYYASKDMPTNPKLNITEDLYMDYAESRRRASILTKTAKDKKLEKIKKKQDPSVSNMIYLFTNACKDLDVKCHFLTRFTGKEAGQAKQFISECKEEGLKLSEVIEDICKYWRKFRIGALTTERGSEIILNSSVNFPDFFVNRHKILMTINSRKSVWDAEARQVVQINHVDLYATDTQTYKH